MAAATAATDALQANMAEQLGEIEALHSIYDDALSVVHTDDSSCCMVDYLYQLSTSDGVPVDDGVRFMLPLTYPSCDNPTFELHSCHSLSADERVILVSLLTDLIAQRAAG